MNRIRMLLLFLLSIISFVLFVSNISPQSFLAIFIAVLLFCLSLFFLIAMLTQKIFGAFIISFSMSAFLLMRLIDALNVINIIIIALLTGSIVALADRT
ncbi:hypothetical protein A2957_03515 [Candidatus Roizmanbacteria bacterium RIFCSPLOWO2_01_FULL_38_11]|uniref:Uncharacterized protein n=1 Tax=Candidatus Roizmanbacteria bacterium RIFCSPLOWO2_01_FULL_38_11 TaxID=1802060 RepID=A0A1F7IPJ0_9BACT|nr:MAG: hypothetical protein A2957_03515 [Candidatus Roizmanbacteria bacterium RIFCSPLOWO2_01_FULL_38_11]